MAAQIGDNARAHLPPSQCRKGQLAPTFAPAKAPLCITQVPWGPPGLTPPRPRQIPVLHRDPQLPSCSPPCSAQPMCWLTGTGEQALPMVKDSQTHASPELAAMSLHAAMPMPGQSLHLLPCERTQSYI